MKSQLLLLKICLNNFSKCQESTPLITLQIQMCRRVKLLLRPPVTFLIWSCNRKTFSLRNPLSSIGQIIWIWCQASKPFPLQWSQLNRDPMPICKLRLKRTISISANSMITGRNNCLLSWRSNLNSSSSLIGGLSFLKMDTSEYFQWSQIKWKVFGVHVKLKVLN
jgi:hypothetical protein